MSFHLCLCLYIYYYLTFLTHGPGGMRHNTQRDLAQSLLKPLQCSSPLQACTGERSPVGGWNWSGSTRYPGQLKRPATSSATREKATRTGRYHKATHACGPPHMAFPMPTLSLYQSLDLSIYVELIQLLSNSLVGMWHCGLLHLNRSLPMLEVDLSGIALT